MNSVLASRSSGTSATGRHRRCFRKLDEGSLIMKVLFIGGTGVISTACTELAAAQGRRSLSCSIAAEPNAPYRIPFTP